MLKLFKYELRKTRPAKLILLGITAVLECWFLYGLLKSDPGTATNAAIFLAMTAQLGTMLIGIQSIVALHRDMNTKQGYMMFMTPHSNYAILGAKTLECTLSVALSGLFFFLLGMLDVNLLFAKFGSIQDLLDFFTNIIRTMRLRIPLDALSIAAFLLNFASAWIETVLIAFFADVIATALLKGKKLGGFLSFVLFILLTIAETKLIGLIPMPDSVTARMLVRTGILAAISAALTVCTAAIMEKRLSV